MWLPGSGADRTRRRPGSPRVSATGHHVGMGASGTDVDRIVAAAAQLPPPEASYLEEDFVMNLFETVLDFQMSTKAVFQ